MKHDVRSRTFIRRIIATSLMVAIQIIANQAKAFVPPNVPFYNDFQNPRGAGTPSDPTYGTKGNDLYRGQTSTTRSPNGQTAQAYTYSKVPKHSAASALGKFARKVGPLATAVAVYDLASELSASWWGNSLRWNRNSHICNWDLSGAQGACGSTVPSISLSDQRESDCSANLLCTYPNGYVNSPGRLNFGSRPVEEHTPVPDSAADTNIENSNRLPDIAKGWEALPEYQPQPQPKPAPSTTPGTATPANPTGDPAATPSPSTSPTPSPSTNPSPATSPVPWPAPSPDTIPWPRPTTVPLPNQIFDSPPVERLMPDGSKIIEREQWVTDKDGNWVKRTWQELVIPPGTLQNPNPTSATITIPSGTTTSGLNSPGSGTNETDCDKYPDIIGCSEYGDPTEPEKLQKKNADIQFSPTAFTSIGSCPPAITFVAFGRTYQLEYISLCNALTQYARPIFLLLGAVLAAFVFIGGLKA